MRQYIGAKIVMAEPYSRLEPLAVEPEQGYKIFYPDGYVSWCPKAAFEEAYRPTDGMNFGLAIEAMKRGLKVARRGWNGKGIHLELQMPDEHSKMTLPYIYIVTTGLITVNPHAPKGCVPWLASQTDMLADDWFIVE